MLYGALRLFSAFILNSFFQNFIKDINECQRDMEICTTENAECINTDGGYMCNCSLGYEGDGEFNCTSKLQLLHTLH